MRFLSFATLVEFIAEHLLVLICCASLVHCVPRLKTTDLTAVQLADFKRNFLNMIGLRNRPPVRTKRSVLQVPDYLWDIYRQLGTGHLRDQNGRRMTAVRSSHGNASYDNGLNGLLVTYPIERLPADERLTKAELRLPAISAIFGSNWTSPSVGLRLDLYEVINQADHVMRLLDTIAIGTGNEISLNVKPAIDRLSADPRQGPKSLVVLLRARSVATPRSSIPWNLSSGTEPADPNRPTLLLYTANPSDPAANRPSAERRQRRTPNRQQHGIYRRRRHQRRHQKRFNGNYSRLLRECRRYELRVDFGELNWQDWVLAPLAYDAYFCQGVCPWPLQDTHNTTNHAIVQSLISEVSRGAVPQPCCVPAELSSISLLYVDWTERVVAKNDCRNSKIRNLQN